MEQRITPQRVKLGDPDQELLQKVDTLEIIKSLQEEEGPKEFSSLRISKWVIDAYREFGQKIGISRHGVLAERILIAGLKELDRQYEESLLKKP